MSSVHAGWCWSVDGEEWADLWRELYSEPIVGWAQAAQAAVATGDVPKDTPFMVKQVGGLGFSWDLGAYTYLLTDDGLYTKVGEA